MKPANSCAALCATALPDSDAAVLAGQQLLAELGMATNISGAADHPAIAWRRSGLLNLSGHKQGPVRMVPVPISGVVDGAILALKALSAHPERLPVNGSLLLGERARLMKLMRNGRASPGGHCRLINARDSRFAINLARDDDWGLLKAWLEEPASSWKDIERIAESRDAEVLVNRGAELGLAIALDALPENRPWFEVANFESVQGERAAPLVVDLSSLWAGPLAGNLLNLMGARVVKVESLARSDGARKGNAKFYQLLNAGKQSVALDFASNQGCSDLKKLIAAADIVIEASRPRAMRQLGVDTDELMAEKPGKLWLRLTAYGVSADRIGFGDDIGVAAGLCTVMERRWGEPLFVGDAIADPISGIFGALAAWTKWTNGGGCVVDLSMRNVVRRAMQMPDNPEDKAAEWQDRAADDTSDLYPMRAPVGDAEDIGESTTQVMANLC